MTKSRVILIGAGAVAKHYADLFSMDANFNVVAVVDVDIKRAKNHAHYWNAHFYKSLVDALEVHSADVAIITTPSGFHYANAKEALNLGLSVLIEKPISLRLSHTKELIELAKTRNLFLLPVFQNRSNKAVKWALNHIKEIGDIKMCSVRLRWSRDQSYYDNSWHGTWLMDGGVSSQQGIHHIDLFLEIGGAVKRVFALESNQSNKLEAEDTMCAVVEFVSGAVGTLELTTSLRPSDADAVVSFSGANGYGEIGGMALNEITKWEIADRKVMEKIDYADISEKVPNGMGYGHRNFITECFDFIQGSATIPPLTPERALITEKFVHALYVSNEKGSWVKIDGGFESNRLGRS
jgi:predicted dehydrogenase